MFAVVYHVEMQMMLQGLNQMCDKKVGVHLAHLELCDCLICYSDGALLKDCCAADAVIFAGTTLGVLCVSQAIQ